MGSTLAAIQLHADIAGNIDGPVRSLLWANPTEKDEVITVIFAEPVAVDIDCVVDRVDPPGVRQVGALIVADRDECLVAEVGVDALNLGEIEPTVRRRDRWLIVEARHRECEVVDVVVDQIEIVLAACQLPELRHGVGEVVRDVRIKAQTPFAACDQSEPRFGNRPRRTVSHRDRGERAHR